MARSIFYDSLKRIVLAFVATMFFAPAFSATLPAGYTQLEYIESTGTQYINTGVKPVDLTKAETEAQFSRIDVRQALLSVNANGSAPWDTFVGVNPPTSLNKFWVQWGGSTGDSVVWQIQTDTNRHKFIFDKAQLSFTVDATTVVMQGYTLSEATNNMYMFAMNAGSAGVDRKAEAKIYYMKIWGANGTLVRDFVPAQTVINGETVNGMYDTVGNQFYRSAASGTNFTAGPATCRNLFDKNNRERILGYFASTGTSWYWARAAYSNRIPCKPNTTYTARYNGNSTQAVLGFGSTSTDDVPTEDGSVSVTQAVRQNNPTINTPVTITTGPNDKWLIVAYNVAEEQNIDMANNLQIEEGSTATSYAPYCTSSGGIKIATTKYNEDAFANLVTTLNSAITKVTNIVDTTVAQASSIGTLATTKQDRPADGDCPAGRKCLLVTGTDGKPHWYLIQE